MSIDQETGMRSRGHLPEADWTMDADDALDDAELRARLRGLITTAAMGPRSHDPARAGTTVAILLDEPDRPEPGPIALMCLDRSPVTVDACGAAAEVELIFTRPDLVRFVRGELHLALAIARGDVDFRGPVRKFLKITPILRALARAAATTTVPEDRA